MAYYSGCPRLYSRVDQTLKYTANMKMKIPKEIEHQYNKAFHLDAGEHAKALPDDDQDPEYSNEYKNEYGKNSMPDEDVKKDDAK